MQESPFNKGAGARMGDWGFLERSLSCIYHTIKIYF